MSGTSAELVEGDTYMVLELLYGMMLPSGNDAATALARWEIYAGFDGDDESNACDWDNPSLIVES